MKMSRQDRDTLERLEEELWREETRFDPRRMTEVIAPDFFEFGSSGRTYTRDDSLAIPRQPIRAVFPLPDFRARLLHPDVAQVTYNSAVTYDGVVQHARRSSIWSRTPSGWVLRFHQGTPFNAKPAAAPNGGPVTPLGNSGGAEGRPSVS
jgi:hypothetical protein